MVEVNRIFGAEKFIFYNFSSGPDVHEYVRDYMGDGMVELAQWPLPVSKHGLLWDVYYYGQLGAQLDCLYRSLYTSRYVSFLDLDEMLVPRGACRTWLKTMESSERDIPVCAFSYRNVFFSLDLPSERKMLHNPVVRDYKIQSLLKSSRETYIWPHGLRSKYIADTRYLELPGIHAPWKCLAKDTVYYVSSKRALLHHYRSWGIPSRSSSSSSSSSWPNVTADRTLYRWRSTILTHILHRHQRHKHLHDT